MGCGAEIAGQITRGSLEVLSVFSRGNPDAGPKKKGWIFRRFSVGAAWVQRTMRVRGADEKEETN